MHRKIRAINARTGEPIDVDPEAIKQSRIKHPALSEALLPRIQAIHDRIRDVYDVTLEQFEIAFMRDADPEREVTVWERIAAAFEKLTRAEPEFGRKMVLRTLLGYSMVALTDAERADPVVQRIIELAEGE